MSVYEPGPDFEQGVYEYWGWHDNRRHAGIDFEAEDGTPIPVAAAGTVVGLGFDATYGNTAIVRHTGPVEPPYRYTLYAHMQATAAVTLGAEISRGVTIGFVSSTGSGGHGVPHLHFELLHLEFTWVSKWQEYNPVYEHWPGRIPLMISNPHGRLHPLEQASWEGLDVYVAPTPKKGSTPRPTSR